MTATTQLQSTAPRSLEQDALKRAEIDRSTRLPVLCFFGASLFWLLVASVAGFLASWKLHDPSFVAEWGWLTFGRIRPLHLNLVAYGWASQAAIGVAIWLLARLCRVPLLNPGLVIAACCLWNLGLILGSFGLLAGFSQGIEWLEFPNLTNFLLFAAYALIAIWGVIMFRFRQAGHVYVSEWYLIAALFWFPWLFATANIMILLQPVQGTVQAAVNWWYGHNVLGLWFTPIGLAAAYYFIPKVIGRPVHSYYLSALGFWTLALFYSWNGMHHLIGGPFPAWMITASIVASVMMVIPVVTTAVNHHLTMVGNFHYLTRSPTLRFVVVGAMIYTLVSLQGSSMAIRSLNKITHFTHYTVGHAHLGLYGFFTMIMFGSMYYIVPRLVGREWLSSLLIKAHFWLSFYGILLMVFVLTVGGVVQGLMLNDPDRSFEDVTNATLPWLRGRSVSGILLLTAHFVFAFHFLMMVLKRGRPAGAPTLFTTKTHKALAPA
jgi:cytochrome c oxidase cbb3-type subunit 1